MSDHSLTVDRVAELEIQLQQARAETKILGKKAHGTLAEWSLELDDDKRHELVKRSSESGSYIRRRDAPTSYTVEQHQRLLDSGAVVLRLHKELRKLTHNDKENEFDSFAISQVERGCKHSPYWLTFD